MFSSLAHGKRLCAGYLSVWDTLPVILSSSSLLCLWQFPYPHVLLSTHLNTRWRLSADLWSSLQHFPLWYSVLWLLAALVSSDSQLSLLNSELPGFVWALAPFTVAWKLSDISNHGKAQGLSHLSLSPRNSGLSLSVVHCLENSFICFEGYFGFLFVCFGGFRPEGKSGAYCCIVAENGSLNVLFLQKCFDK